MGWIRDIRFAGRRLRGRPASSAGAVGALALGIGLAVSIFAVVDGVLLRSLPYHDPGRLAVVWEDHSRVGGLPRFSLSPTAFRDVRSEVDGFESVAAYLVSAATLTGAGDPEILSGAGVSEDFFAVLGVDAARGRTLGPGDGPGDRVVVLSDGVWRGRFGADPGIVGRTVVLDGEAHTVLGVMPADFWVPLQLRAPALRDQRIWRPLEIPEAWDNRSTNVLQILARLREGVSIEAARAEADAVARRLTESGTDATGAQGADGGVGAVVVPLREQLLGPVEPVLLLLLGGVATVLLIACANVANLLLVRGAANVRVRSVRAALGAGRLRLLREGLIEAGIIAALGGAAGLVGAWWGADLLRRLAPPELPRAAAIEVDLRIAAFALAVTAATALLFGLLPAFRGASARPAASLTSRGSVGDGRRSGLIRDVLIGVQVALTLVLVVGAATFTRTFLELRAVDPGFTVGDAVTFLVVLPGQRYPDVTARTRTFAEIRRALLARPAVRSVGAINRLPLEPAYGMARVFTGDETDLQEAPQAGFRSVTPGYFEVLEIPVVRGRAPDARDGASGPLVVVANEAAARRFWPERDPVGASVRFGRPGSAPWMVVGVVGNVRHDGMDAAAVPEFYAHVSQASTGSLVMVARGEASGVLPPAVRGALAEVDPLLAPLDLRTLEARVARSLAVERAAAALLGAFAWATLLLAALGVYSVVSFTVVSRRREIGVRAALGAGPGRLSRWFVLRGVAPAAAGVGAGTAFLLLGRGAVSGTPALRGSAFDPGLLLAGGAVLLAAAVLAAWLPGRRASRLDPVEVLRGG